MINRDKIMNDAPKNISTISNPVIYRLALVTWFLIALLNTGLFWVHEVATYSELLVPCAGEPGVFEDCNAAALTTAEKAVWTSWGFSMQAYAIISLGGAAFSFLVYISLAGLILWRQRQSWLGLTVSLALVVLPARFFAGSRDFAAIDPVLLWPAVVVGALGNVIVLLFLYLMPNGRFSPRWAYIPLIATLIMVNLMGSRTAGILSLSPQVILIVNVAIVGLVLFGASTQIYRYVRDTNAVEKQQTKWVIFGVLIFITNILSWVLVFGRALPIPGGSPRILANLIGVAYGQYFSIPFLPVAITIAILRYRLWGIDALIRRTLIYLLLSGFLAFVYFGLVTLLQSLFNRFSNQQSPFVIIISTLAIAALFSPLRRRIQAFIDRRFFRRSYNAQQVLAEFAATARDQVELEQLTRSIHHSIEEALQPATVSVWLEQERKTARNG